MKRQQQVLAISVRVAVFFPFPASVRVVAVGAHSLTAVFCTCYEKAISYSAILTGENCVVADQTGSGKTLAYLAPLVQRLRYGAVRYGAVRCDHS